MDRKKMMIDFSEAELEAAAPAHQFRLDPAGLKDTSGKTGIVYGWYELQGTRDYRQTLERAIKARDGED
jgi:hypothetical protein